MKTVAGLDVHKDSVYLCILRENGEKIERVYGVLTHNSTPCAILWQKQSQRSRNGKHKCVLDSHLARTC